MSLLLVDEVLVLLRRENEKFRYFSCFDEIWKNGCYEDKNGCYEDRKSYMLKTRVND